MRTTVNLDDDVAKAIARIRRERSDGLSEVVNDLIRRGLAQQRSTQERFVQETSAMGVSRLALDDIAGLLDAVEGDDRR